MSSNQQSQQQHFGTVARGATLHGEEAYESSPHHPLAQSQFDQQQFMAAMQHQQQFMNKGIPQSVQSSFADHEHQYGGANTNPMLSGRFGGQTPTQAQSESYRYQSQQMLKPNYSQNISMQFQSQPQNMGGDNFSLASLLGQQPNQLDNALKLLQSLPQNQKMGFSQTQPQQQSRDVLSELLKLQQNQTPVMQPQTPPPMAQNLPFGREFLNAHQLLANLNIGQPSQGNLLQEQQIQQIQQPMNQSVFQQMLQNSQINQYQQLVDQMERQGSLSTPSQTVSQSTYNPVNNRPQQNLYAPPQPHQVVQSPTQNHYMAGNSYGQYNQRDTVAPSLNTSLLPSQSDLIRSQNQQQNKQYQELNDYEGNMYLNTQNTGKNQYMEATSQSIMQEEPYGAAQSTVSNSKQYNPHAYGNYSKPDETEDAYHHQRSPPGAQRNAMQKPMNSPKGNGVSWMSKQQNEPLSYLNSYNNNNAQKFSDGANSPLRQSMTKLPDVMTNYPGGHQNMLENSINRGTHIASQNTYFLDNSHNSSSILQEHYMNNQQQQQHNYDRQPKNQYSPSASSTHRYDENRDHIPEMNSSVHMGAKQQVHQILNVDDIPIVKPKTFEELLEENLMKMGMKVEPISDEIDDEERKQSKKEFLKRKSQKAPVAVPTKKYNYYAENFEETKKRDTSSTSPAVRAQPSTVSERAMKHEEKLLPAPIQNSNPFAKQQSVENNLSNRPVSPIDNVHGDKYQEGGPDSRTKSATKKRFLTRGSGTAGGKQGTNNQKVTPKEKAKDGRKRTANQLLSDDEYPNDFNFAAEQDNKSPKLNQQTFLSRQQAAQNKPRKLEAEINRDSIAEFEKLEQEVNKNMQQINTSKRVSTDQQVNVQQYNSTKAAENKQQLGKQRRKKLFDDSDTNEEDDEDDDVVESKPEEVKRQYSSVDNTPNEQTEDAPKSNVVKKFFYKEDPNAKRPPTQPAQSKSTSDLGVTATTEYERAMKQKMDQLDKAIDAYNQQNEMAQKLKREYESLLGKQRVDFRDFEGKKKKELEELERLKAEEVEKLKKERKLLEQRQKNLQLVNNNNKKERDEIDFLKRELQRVQEEAKGKEAKQKATIERLNKQAEEMRAKNKELQDELKHVTEQLRSQPAKNITPSATPSDRQNVSQQNISSRYTFSSNPANNKSIEIQPKGILKKNNDQQPVNRPISPSHFYNEDNQHEDEDVEEDEEAHALSEEEEEDEEEEVNYGGEPQVDVGSSKNVSFRKREETNQTQQPNTNPAPAIPPSNEDEEFDMKFPQPYHNKNTPNMRVVEQIIGHDGKIQRVYENGKKEVIFNNGVKREVFPDGYTIVYFNNNDIKQTYPDQKVVYYFAEAKTTQTTFSDGLQVFKFANNQIEKHFPDGTKEIIFPDGTIKCIFADGEEESIFPDGTIQRIEKNGVKAIEFANGQKDIHFPDGTRIREYPDGRVRKTYADGTQENTVRGEQQ